MIKPQNHVHDGPDRRQNPDNDSYFNAQFGAKPIYVKPGEFATSSNIGEMLVANVGSGIVIAICDKDLKIGGLAHIVLPQKALDIFPYFDKLDKTDLDRITKPFKTCLYDLKNHGAGKNRIRMRLIGGSITPQDTQDKGTKTRVFVKEYLTRQGLDIMNEDVAGSHIRRVHYFPSTGRAVRKILRRLEDLEQIEQEEQEFQDLFDIE